MAAEHSPPLGRGGNSEEEHPGEKAATYLSHNCRGRSGENPQPRIRDSRKTGGEMNDFKKQPRQLTPFSGYIKAFVSTGVNSCY